MKKVLKEYRDKTIIDINGIKIGSDDFVVIAGPCSVESEHQLMETAKKVKEYGGQILRGGTFKPRTSPYSFQGLREEGLDILSKAKKELKIPIISELMDEKYIHLYDDVDIIQIGSRNMQNYELLKAVGKLNKPVMLKRSFSATIDEWLNAAEYIMNEGNEQIILCERGIRTFSDATRFTLDVSCIPVVKEITHLPVIVDPSHAAGDRKYVKPLALAAKAVGADGVIVETHINPDEALSDASQQITPDKFKDLIEEFNK